VDDAKRHLVDDAKRHLVDDAKRHLVDDAKRHCQPAIAASHGPPENRRLTESGNPAPQP
jgi:hypothetical protein